MNKIGRLATIYLRQSSHSLFTSSPRSSFHHEYLFPPKVISFSAPMHHTKQNTHPFSTKTSGNEIEPFSDDDELLESEFTTPVLTEEVPVSEDELLALSVEERMIESAFHALKGRYNEALPHYDLMIGHVRAPSNSFHKHIIPFFVPHNKQKDNAK
jgi:hypothetical protein